MVYIFLGPGGVHTLDPTIKPKWVEPVGANYAILQKLNMIKELNIGAWVNDSYVRQAFKDLGLDYDKQLASFDTATRSPAPIRSATRRSTTPHKPVKSGSRAATSCRSALRSARCWASRSSPPKARNSTPSIWSIMNSASRCSPTPHSTRSAAEDPKKPDVVPFLLKKDAEDYAAKNGGKLATYTEVLAAINVGQ